MEILLAYLVAAAATDPEVTAHVFTQVTLTDILLAIIAVAGGGWGVVAQRTKNKHDRALAAETAKRETEERRRADAFLLVDQLQEERTAQDHRHGQLLERIDRMWADKAASREYVAELRDHIWARKEPPPPEAPAGYIP